MGDQGREQGQQRECQQRDAAQGHTPARLGREPQRGQCPQRGGKLQPGIHPGQVVRELALVARDREHA
jgi:hypothetical protein